MKMLFQYVNTQKGSLKTLKCRATVSCVVNAHKQCQDKNMHKQQEQNLFRKQQLKKLVEKGDK